MFNNLKFKKKTLSQWIEFLTTGQSQLAEVSHAHSKKLTELAHSTDGNSSQGYVADANQMEYYAEMMRFQGQSGVCNVRQYTFGGTHAYHRPFNVGYSALSIHDHPNYRGMPGMGEFAAMINGYYVRTRHNDYRLRKNQPSGSGFLRTVDIEPPAVPASVLAKSTPTDQIVEMRKYMKAYADTDTSVVDFRTHFEWTMSYLECWFEPFESSLTDTYDSFRHQVEADSMMKLLRKVLKFNAGGHKNNAENIPFLSTPVRMISDQGNPVFVTLKYRICCANVGNLRDYPKASVLALVDDWKSQERFDQTMLELEASSSRSVRYKLKESSADNTRVMSPAGNILDDFMGKVSGLDGDGANLGEKYTDNSGREEELYAYGAKQKLNAAYYNRFNSFLRRDASNRSNQRRGFNDPMLFVASTTQSKVLNVSDDGNSLRFSYAIPIELILRTPLENFNPHSLPEVTRTAASAGGKDGSQAKPLNGFAKDLYNYHIPAAFFTDNKPNGDPADTNLGKKYVNDSSGVAQAVVASGIYTHLPEIQGVAVPETTDNRIRVRHPIYPVHQEGSHEHAEIQAIQKRVEAIEALNPNKITVT